MRGGIKAVKPAFCRICPGKSPIGALRQNRATRFLCYSMWAVAETRWVSHAEIRGLSLPRRRILSQPREHGGVGLHAFFFGWPRGARFRTAFSYAGGREARRAGVSAEFRQRAPRRSSKQPCWRAWSWRRISFEQQSSCQRERHQLFRGQWRPFERRVAGFLPRTRHVPH